MSVYSVSSVVEKEDFFIRGLAVLSSDIEKSDHMLFKKYPPLSELVIEEKWAVYRGHEC